MKICYIDEAGDGRWPDQRRADVPPAFVICGLVVDSSNLPALADGLPAAKARFRSPSAGSQMPDGIRHPDEYQGKRAVSVKFEFNFWHG